VYARGNENVCVVLLFCSLFFFIIYSSALPHYALSQIAIGKPIGINSTTKSTPYKAVRLVGPIFQNNLTRLRTTDANVSDLQFTTSYNYQYITWTEHKGRENVIFVASSRDGGHTFDPASNLSSIIGDASNDHFVVNLDRMYGVFIQHEPSNDDVIKFAGTNDGGMHWTVSTLINTHKLVNELAIALQGNEVSVTWADSDGTKTVNQYVVNH
jgi:hypothetical protein